MLPTIKADNPYYKDLSAAVLREFVEELSGPEKSEVILAMIKEAPASEIQKVMRDYSLFKSRVLESIELLSVRDDEPCKY